MAWTNYERIGKAMELLKAGLGPFVEREMENAYPKQAWKQAIQFTGEDRLLIEKPVAEWDAAALLKLLWDAWNDVFRKVLGTAERSLVSELREQRSRWGLQQVFSSDDADRALDSMARLLSAVSAPQADEVGKMKMELRRLIFDEQMRQERRKSAGAAVGQAAGALKPWREVVRPHRDVASGRYQQDEFAADLWQVHIGEGSDEYRRPAEFFRRTFLTDSLRQLLIGAVRRLNGEGGNPVVQLQTHFGGGKTHSMLALYHLFSGTAPGELMGIDDVLKETGVPAALPEVRRVVLVGNRISPGNPVIKPDGTVIRTLWGELAWQLGGEKAFACIQADDEKATSPGDVLRELINEYGPSLILIDEWVAYARQLHDTSDLPGGSFETQFTFAQALSESAKLARQCQLVISLPACDTTGSPDAEPEDVEVGGERGREALDRLRNAVGRVESSWRPASTGESFEIVRRRLFEPIVEKEQFAARDTVARAFYDGYRTRQKRFPPECHSSEYEERIRAAYPIHPEIFDRLYTGWSTLLKFQRTRGVLRLMAAVIQSLWENGDCSPLIMPGNLPIDDARVQFELTRYLSDDWKPVIERDVDGPNALPLRLDGEVPNLGKFSACRRVARTIYLGSAHAPAADRGVEERRVKLGCVMPGESPAIFADALRRLGAAATYLYQDGPQYWYSTQPTVTKIAEDRAEQLKHNPEAVFAELDRRLRADPRQEGDFERIHPLPQSGQDVPDLMDARLVVLGIDSPYSKGPDNRAVAAAKAILEDCGNSPRLYRNALVFLAVDKTRLQDLDKAIRRSVAWGSVLDEKEKLDLSPRQVKQAETQKKSADGAVIARIHEAYQWLIVPVQTSPQAELEWRAFRLSGSGALAVRAGKKLLNEDLFVTTLAGTVLRSEMDKVPLWRGNHVAIKQLAQDFARYPYLPRLKGPEVLLGAVRDGLDLLTWTQDAFAYADSFDEEAGRYRGLRTGQLVSISTESLSGLLVQPAVALKQQQAEVSPSPGIPAGAAGAAVTGTQTVPPGVSPIPGVAPPPDTKRESGPKRFHGSVILDAAWVARDAGRVADEVLAHLAGQAGSKVTVTLEIEAEIPGGTPEDVIRTVTENSRTLKFTSKEFEGE